MYIARFSSMVAMANRSEKSNPQTLREAAEAAVRQAMSEHLFLPKDQVLFNALSRDTSKQQGRRLGERRAEQLAAGAPVESE
jgi:hypothetical protein